MKIFGLVPDGGGLAVYRSGGILSIAETKSIDILNEFALHQNYPNPFNPSTTISYQLLRADYVTLKVFDVLGNEVAILVNEEKPVGNYEIEFDASQLSSGVYYYQLRTGEFVETKKMILLR